MSIVSQTTFSIYEGWIGEEKDDRNRKRDGEREREREREKERRNQTQLRRELHNVKGSARLTELILIFKHREKKDLKHIGQQVRVHRFYMRC